MSVKPIVSSVPLSYSLGADDIGKIVDALLPTLTSLLSQLTKDQQYVFLHKAVLKLSTGKSFSNKDELDTIVKDIVKDIVKKIINSLSNKNIIKANPDALCPTSLGLESSPCV